MTPGRLPQSMRVAAQQQPCRLAATRDTVGAGTTDSNDDVSKWEDMFSCGEARRQLVPGGFEYGDGTAISRNYGANEIRVVSFDLDNTLWITAEVIGGANDALAAFLSEKEIQQPKRTEAFMKTLFEANKAKYSPLLKEDAKGPVNLTQLRTDATEQILKQYNGYSSADARVLATEAFGVWTTARHEAILHNMADNVVETLSRIRESLQSQTGASVIIGGITDGNSDPTRVACLAPFFDFCVNAEQIGVSKPDARVYLHAIEKVLPTLPDGLTMVEEQVGPWWVHSGDDFIKDIVAAKGLGMRTVWCRELVKDSSTAETPSSAPSPSRTVEDLIKQVSSMKVVEMQVGADDYLADSFREEFADAVVDRFADLAPLLEGWHTEGQVAPCSATTETSLDEIAEGNKLEEKSPLSAVPAAGPTEAASAPPATDTKFCVYCGERLPKPAKFCSYCGEEQPALP
jgi:FMN phosphatase YigB (HAD superfamily)